MGRCHKHTNARARTGVRGNDDVRDLYVHSGDGRGGDGRRRGDGHRRDGHRRDDHHRDDAHLHDDRLRDARLRDDPRRDVLRYDDDRRGGRHAILRRLSEA